MSLVPMMFSDWWDDFDPLSRRFRDQYLGLAADLWTDALEPLELTEAALLQRPRRYRRRYHPFPRSLQGRKQPARGGSGAQDAKDRFMVTLDVQQFAPDEIKVKVVDRNVIVEAKHEEKQDEHGWISREFVRKYLLPAHCDVDQVSSSLSSDGFLTITAPRRDLQNSSSERTVKIQYTGQPAIANYDGPLSSSPSAENAPSDQAQQKPQQQQQQQQHRGRKATVKAT